MNEAEKRIMKISNSGAVFNIKHQASGQHLLIKTIFSDITRSKKNIEKQKSQDKIQNEFYRIQAVPILFEEMGRDSYVVKMAYIEGISGDRFLVRGSRDVAKQLKGSLGLFLEKLLSESYEQEITSAIFVEKASAVLEATLCPRLKVELKACFEVLQECCRKNHYFPIGKCHGDLTLSNMIISNNGTVHLIDYLDTFFESPLQDVVKIMQDFVYGWSFRYEQSAAKLSAKIFCRHSTPTLLVNLKRKYGVQIKILLILTLMRIAPYVDDELTRTWLIRVLRQEVAR